MASRFLQLIETGARCELTGEQVMSFSSASSASSLGKIAVDLASNALEDFLENEEIQKTIVKTVAS
ncbi:MAG: hypothetical protein LH702_19220, partial [Phormidesmis sp. CAN_BIN44]|nr:hypothetical protein [Phormidesmis sp. CAN_BIN44]